MKRKRCKDCDKAKIISKTRVYCTNGSCYGYKSINRTCTIQGELADVVQEKTRD